jgi:hypothetical protein
MAEGAVLTMEERPIDDTAPSGDWLSALRRYVVISALGNLLWEFAQLPLYTVWHEGSPQEIVFAAVHCTGGDVLIATMSLLAGLLLAGTRRWPHARFAAVALITVLGGLAYTMFSEWLNTEIRGSWAYSEWMPTLPLIGAGLSPFAQWLVVPAAALWWARRAHIMVAVRDPGRG